MEWILLIAFFATVFIFSYNHQSWKSNTEFLLKDIEYEDGIIDVVFYDETVVVTIQKTITFKEFKKNYIWDIDEQRYVSI